jgi:hypothetical protein
MLEEEIIEIIGYVLFIGAFIWVMMKYLMGMSPEEIEEAEKEWDNEESNTE